MVEGGGSLQHLRGKIRRGIIGIINFISNVGNELGKGLVSVLTESGGAELDAMEGGLVHRYKATVEPSPVAL